MNCPDCSSPVEKDAKFCPKCYARIEPPSLWQRLISPLQAPTKPGLHVLNTEKTVTITTLDREGNRHEYHSVDEVPLGMRSQIEKLESEVIKERVGLFSPEPPVQAKDQPGIIIRKILQLTNSKTRRGKSMFITHLTNCRRKFRRHCGDCKDLPARSRGEARPSRCAPIWFHAFCLAARP